MCSVRSQKTFFFFRYCFFLTSFVIRFYWLLKLNTLETRNKIDISLFLIFLYSSMNLIGMRKSWEDVEFYFCSEFLCFFFCFLQSEASNSHKTTLIVEFGFNFIFFPSCISRLLSLVFSACKNDTIYLLVATIHLVASSLPSRQRIPRVRTFYMEWEWTVELSTLEWATRRNLLVLRIHVFVHWVMFCLQGAFLCRFFSAASLPHQIIVYWPRETRAKQKDAKCETKVNAIVVNNPDKSSVRMMLSSFGANLER